MAEVPDDMSQQQAEELYGGMRTAFQSSSGAMGSSDGTASSSSTLPVNLTVDDLGLVQEELYEIRTHWFNMGLKLGVKVDVLKSIRSQWNSPEDCFREMLMEYLQSVNPSWRALVGALKSRTVNKPQLAVKVEQMYCLETSLSLPQQPLPNEQKTSMPSFSPGSDASTDTVKSTPSSLPPYDDRATTTLPECIQMKGGSTTVSIPYPSILHEDVITDTSARLDDKRKDAGAATLTPPVSPANTQPQSRPTQRKRALEDNYGDRDDEIVAEIDKLQNDYASLVNGAKKLVKKKRITVDEFRTAITLLPLRMENREEQQHYIKKHFSEINNSENIEEIFNLLNLCVWNYINYQLLEHIVHLYGDDEAKEMMEQYVTALDGFKRKTTLQEFLNVQSKRRCPEIPDTLRQEMTEVVITNNKLTLASSLYDIDQFRLELAEHYSLPEFAVITAGIKPGSVTIVMLMTQPAATMLQEKIEKEKSVFLQKHDVTELTIDGKTLYTSGTDESTTFTTPKLCDQYSSVFTASFTAQSVEKSTTPSSEDTQPQASPPERRALKTEEYRFDIFDALLRAGIPHIVLLITTFLSLSSLAVAEQVSTLWMEIVENLHIWKKAVQRNVETSPLWQGIFERRGWHMYVSQESSHSGSINYLYRQLHRSISKDIHSLHDNWKRGHYNLTNIETGSPVYCLQFDSKRIVSGHFDNTIKVWDKDTMKLLNTLTGHKDLVLCLQFIDDLIISGSSDNSVKVWDTQTGQVINELLHHRHWVRSLKFKSELLVTGSSDQTVALLEFKSPTDITLKKILKGHESYVYAVDISDSYIISGSVDRSIKVWDSSSGELLHTFQHSDWVYSLQCRGSLIVSGCSAGTIRLWDSETETCLKEWKGHEDLVRCIAFDDEHIVTGSRDCTVKVWSMSAVLEPDSSKDQLCPTTLEEHSDYVRAVQMDVFQVISGSFDTTIQIYDFTPPAPDHIIVPPQLT